MEDCIFCKISKKEIPADIIAETSSLLAFPDIHPSAPIHILIIPKTHYADVTKLPDELFVQIKDMALRISREKKMSGFRLVANAGTAAQIAHMHMHLLSGIKKSKKV